MGILDAHLNGLGFVVVGLVVWAFAYRAAVKFPEQELQWSLEFVRGLLPLISGVVLLRVAHDRWSESRLIAILALFGAVVAFVVTVANPTLLFQSLKKAPGIVDVGHEVRDCASIFVVVGVDAFVLAALVVSGWNLIAASTRVGMLSAAAAAVFSLLKHRPKRWNPISRGASTFANVRQAMNVPPSTVERETGVAMIARTFETGAKRTK